MVFPIKMTNKASFILILNIYANVADHKTIVGSGTPTNIISPIILVAFSFLIFLPFFYQPILLLSLNISYVLSNLLLV